MLTIVENCDQAELNERERFWINRADRYMDRWGDDTMKKPPNPPENVLEFAAMQEVIECYEVTGMTMHEQMAEELAAERGITFEEALKEVDTWLW